MQATQGSLVIIGANTDVPQVFWNGTQVQGITAITVDNDSDSKRVVLTFQEGPILTEMAAAGVIIKRSI